VGGVYYAVVLTFLIQFSLMVYLGTLFVCFLVVVLYLGLLYGLLVPSGSFSIRGPLLAGLLWMLIEWIAGLTPLSGLVFQEPFYGPEPFLRIASITGFGLLPGIILALNFSLAVFIKKRERCAGKAAFAFALALLFVGGIGMFYPSTRSPGSLRIAIIQHDLPPASSDSWRNSEHMVEIREKYFRLAQEAMLSNPDLIVFPLYTISGITQKDLLFLPELARQTGKHILFASHFRVNADAGPPVYPNPIFHLNAAMLLDPSGEVVGSYQAIRAPHTEKGVKLADRYKVIETAFGKIGLLLCYENFFSSVVKKAVDDGAEFLIALSNAGTFQGSFVPRQNLLQDQLRSIESGRFMIRVTPNGYSAVVDPWGRVLKKTKLYHEEVLIADISKITSKTIFHKIFYFIPPLFLLLLVGLLVRRKNH
jgi:apolipoprotein N-acyltransferase